MIIALVLISSVSATDNTPNTTDNPETTILTTTTNNTADTVTTVADDVDTINTATDNTVASTNNDKDNDDNSDSDDNVLLESADNNELLSDTSGTWTDLESEVTATGTTITLTKNTYTYDSSTDNHKFNITNKIIDGNGATIDGNNAVAPFTSNGNLTIKNINFQNIQTDEGATTTYYNAAVIGFQSGSSNILIENCNFTNIKSTKDGTSILSFPDANNITIKKCNFKDSATCTVNIRFHGTNTSNITITENTFNNVNTTTYDGIMAFSSDYTSNILIDKLTLENNYCAKHLLIVNTVNNITIKNMITNQISMNNYLIYFYGLVTNFLMDNCKIENITKVGGRLISFMDSSYSHTNITINNTSFNNIPSTDIIRCIPGKNYPMYNFRVSYCNFTNHAGNHAIFIGSSSGNYYNTYIGHCIFENLTQRGAGGAIGLQGYNKASDFAYQANNTTIEYCTFKNISGSNVGSAIELKSLNNILQYCTFTNISGKDGGAICFFSWTQNTTFNYCNFTNCHASTYGGALVAKEAGCINTEIYNCNFINCSAATAGGALCFNGNNSQMSNCTFINNTVTSTDSSGEAHGGAVQFNANNGYLGFCTFINNTCPYGDGGALCSNGKGSTVENCTFTNNSASKGKDFYAHTGCTITFIGLKFTELWLTNENLTDESDTSINAWVTNGFGTSLDRPAAWDDQDIWSSCLDNSSGQTTIYLVSI